jgi:hypothetical protein
MKVKFDDGVHNITSEQYHGADGISRSQLMLLDKSPYHFWYEVISGMAEKREATPAMNIGSAFHTLLLEPQLFDHEFCVMPNLDRRTKGGKEMYQQFMEENAGKMVLSVEQYEKAALMAEQALSHEIVKTLLDEAQFEQSIFWTDAETGLQFKSRPDIWSPKMVVDLKTTQDATRYKFERSAIEYGYYLQAGMAFEGAKALQMPFEMFVILAVEKEMPHAPAVFPLSDDALQYGIDQFQFYKRMLADCMSSNQWDTYAVQELTVPMYAIKSLEDE